MQKYKKRPVVIEAMRIDDSLFTDDHPNPNHIPGLIYDPCTKKVHIPTLEGTMTGDLGDWIIKGVKGEIYPCKHDIFVATYDLVSADGDSVYGMAFFR